MKKYILILLFASLGIDIHAQRTPVPSDFTQACDSLSARLQRKTTVKSELKVYRVVKRASFLDITFTNTLSDYPWNKALNSWFRKELSSELENVTKSYKLGRISTRNCSLDELTLPEPGTDGKAASYNLATVDPRSLEHNRFIERVGAKRFPGGMTDRYIALWQSHGRYYDANTDSWRWQRAPIHRTIEDVYTQSYVLPFLIPMLENAGAYIMTPRERDTQWREHIIDNDKAFSGPRDAQTRKTGFYSEKGSWKDAGSGFADLKKTYTFADLPFQAGTARICDCSGAKADAIASWTPEIEERGFYSVYVSYSTVDNSCTSARYTVNHLGGKTEFRVNQKMGGGTWIYLGTFEFDKGTGGSVILDNRGDTGQAVTADAVKIGGGMGKLERGGCTSGLPSYVEGAHYWMQWSGIEPDITQNWSDDYTNDFASRGAWTEMMKEKKGIPFDLSLAFHSDAGLTQNDSIIGTLAIYTYLRDNKKKFEDGRSRLTSRLLADYVQNQVVNDIRADFEPEWSRRELMDKSYSECRTTGVPGMILELLSHQNFADMRLGLDPSFRFEVSRSVYKGLLKTLSAFYNTPYIVQPLPVNSFSSVFSSENSVTLSWKPTIDEKEPTAVPTSYFVYTRIDGGAFDNGSEIKGTQVQMSIEPGHIYSYKVVACNNGGLSFPSEILSVGRPAAGGKEIAIVNNFYRVSAPDWIDNPGYAGFDGKSDNGVPYLTDISYVGDNYEFHRDSEYLDDDFPGFGASTSDHAGEIIAGNSFDYPYIHGKSLMSLGYAFSSMSMSAFCENGTDAPVIDLICGKEKTTKIGRGAVPDRYKVFPDTLKQALRHYTSNGGNVLVSGCNIGSDEMGTGFTEDVFGFKCKTPTGSKRGRIGNYEFYTDPNAFEYCVECPDAIFPIGLRSRSLLKYANTSNSAAVYHNGGKYRTVSIGVPIETVKSEKDRESLFRMSLQALQTN